MLLFGCKQIFHQMPKNLSTLLIWTFYWQKVFKQEWAVKRYRTSNFTLIEWSARQRNMWRWCHLKGHIHKNWVCLMKTITFLRWQLPNSGIMVTARGEFCLALKSALSAMKGQLVHHLIMTLHTMHKIDFYTMTCSPKTLFFLRTGHSVVGFLSLALT